MFRLSFVDLALWARHIGKSWLTPSCYSSQFEPIGFIWQGLERIWRHNYINLTYRKNQYTCRYLGSSFYFDNRLHKYARAKKSDPAHSFGCAGSGNLFGKPEFVSGYLVACQALSAASTASNISWIWSSVMISGGQKATVSPRARRMTPCSRQASTTALPAAP